MNESAETVILFQGDSITDCGRNNSNRQFGDGYALLACARLLEEFPRTRFRFANKGISGNRVKDLEARWDADCIGLKPDVVSVLIGINDTWRRYDRGDPTSAEDFERGYRRILERTKACGAKIILLEPFVLPCPADREAWREDLDPKIGATRRLAREFADAFVPLDGIFASAALATGPEHWAPDGVHPSLAGHMLIAREWVKAYRIATGS